MRWTPSTLASVWCGVALSLAACFTGDFLAGIPCGDDFECGPGHQCLEGRCDGLVQGNEAPRARDDRYETYMNREYVVGEAAADRLLANDEDPDGYALTLRGDAVATRRGGEVTFNGGAFTYTPPPDFWGCDSFTYEIEDVYGVTATAKAYISVRPTAAPLARAAEVGSGHRFAANDASLAIGSAVAGIGDHDGDGFADLAIGANRRSAGATPSNSRQIYVVLGGEDLSTRTLSGVEAGVGGYLIDFGAVDLELDEDPAGQVWSPHSIRGAGDIDGDGLADLVVSDPALGVSVVLGRPEPAAIDLAQLQAGDGGFIIVGETHDDLIGAAAASAGDVNADGRGDLLIGAPGHVGEQGVLGRAYVVFGRAAGTPVQLAAIAAGDGGYTITPVYTADDGFGGLLAAGHDVNGDGRPDMVVGTAAGVWRAQVVFGQADATPVRLTYDAAAGFLIYALPAWGEPDPADPLLQLELSPDVDGDGRAEVLFRTAAQTDLVYGKADTEIVNIRQDPAAGFELEVHGNRTAAAAGDLDGDGLAEVMVAADDRTLDDTQDPGRVLVFRGPPGPEPLEELGPEVFAFVGGSPGARTGEALARAGDVDGDVSVDLIIGSPGEGVVDVVRSGTCD